MKPIALIVAIVLLAVGFYRLLVPARPARPSALPAPRPPAPAAGGEPTKKETPEKSAPAASAPAVTEPTKPRAKAEPAAALPSLVQDHEADEDITIITLAPPPEVVAAMNALAAKAAPRASQPGNEAGPTPAPEAAGPPKVAPPSDDDDDDDDADDGPSAVPIVYDEDAAIDEPTRISALILVSAAAQTDQGRKRRRNEDSFVVLEDHHLFVVADGMGGHAGGDVASKMAVETIADAFRKNTFNGEPYPDVPRRGAELAVAIQMANRAIYDHARANQAYQGMGTTVVSARFSPNKQRVYFGHVGDSRCYRLRSQALTQVTTDHTMGAQGVTGPLANHLNRAVGVAPGVKVDLLIARPRP
jgi:Protein phosphatase 2C